MQTAQEGTALRVPFKDRDFAKQAGARWSAARKEWFAPPGADLGDLDRWLPRQAKARPIDLSTVAFGLDVPFDEREHAKAAGARWYEPRGAWVAPSGKEEALDQWRVKEPPIAMAVGGISLAEALLDAGIDEPDPIVDQKWHRAPTIDGKRGNKNGAYIAFDDGVPSAYIKNHATGQERTWSAAARREPVSQSQRAGWSVEMDLARLRREKIAAEQYERAGASAATRFAALPDAPDTLPYLVKKGIVAMGAKADGDSLVVPARDIDGAITTLQTIGPEGGKLFMQGGKKAGSFFLVGDIAPGSDILIAEGFATAASLRMATGLPVAVAFDAGNLRPVAEAIAKAHPQSMVAIMADDDRFAAANAGIEKGRAAADAVGAAMLAPRFPETAPGKPTDWNDLHALAGLDAVFSQASEGLRAERARLRDQAIAGLRADNPQLDIAIADTKAGRDMGAARSLGHGFFALLGEGGNATVHESRRVSPLPMEGQRVRVDYKKGKGVASAAPIRERIAGRSR